MRLGEGVVVLGQPLGWAARYTFAPDDSVVLVPLGDSTMVDHIVVVRSATDRVRSISIVYSAPSAFDRLLTSARDTLGPPSDSTIVPVEQWRRRVYIWRDRRTEVRLTQMLPIIEDMIAVTEIIDREP
jgi:hypothetical protein